MTCWHCQGTHACDCILCRGDKTSGPCQACIGRQRVIPNIDVRNSANYELVKPEAPAHAFRRLRIEGGTSESFTQ